MVKGVGIIGCGLMGHRRAESLKKFNLELVSVCDTTLSKAKELSNKYHCLCTEHPKDVFNNPDIDLVIISTSHDKLAELTIEALENGMHVLVEKPAGINSKEIEKVIGVYRNKYQRIKVGYNHRFHPSIIKAKELIENLGKIMFIRAFYGNGARPGFNTEWRTKLKLSGGGELIDQGSHLIDLTRYFLGDVKPIFGINKTYFWDIGVEDNCFFLLESKIGQISHLHTSWTEWKNAFRMDIMCEKGELSISGLGKSYGKETLTVYRMKPEMGPPLEENYISLEDKSWELELRDLFNSIKEGREPNGNIYDAYENMKIIEGVYKCRISQ